VVATPASHPRPTKSRLWNDVKLQAITRAVTSIYVIPLVVLQTTSQLSIIARKQYLRELHAVRSSIEGSCTAASSLEPSSHPKWYQPWSYFSVQGMGLAWVEDDTPALSQTPSTVQGADSADVDRIFLCFSWWLLHVGWQIIEHNVASVVQEICGDMKLKQTISMADWQDLLKTIRTKVEEQLGAASPRSDSPLVIALLPPSSSSDYQELLSRYPTVGRCPLPSPPHSSTLEALLGQMSAHFSSPDFGFLFARLVDSLQDDLLGQLSDEVYGGAMEGGATAEAAILPLTTKEPERRLAACLPTIGNWSKDVWQGYPDKIVDVSACDGARLPRIVK